MDSDLLCLIVYNKKKIFSLDIWFANVYITLNNLSSFYPVSTIQIHTKSKNYIFNENRFWKKKNSYTPNSFLIRQFNIIKNKINLTKMTSFMKHFPQNYVKRETLMRVAGHHINAESTKYLLNNPAQPYPNNWVVWANKNAATVCIFLW